MNLTRRLHVSLEGRVRWSPAHITVLLVALMTLVACGGGNADNQPETSVIPFPTRLIPDPVLHAPLSENNVASFAPSDLPGVAGSVGSFGERVERCVAQGGTLDECTGTAGLCAVRDAAIDTLGGDLFDALGLGELGNNYYCEGECFHCCWVPGDGPGGAGGGCHTSFDTSEGPVVNCNAGTYGAGTVGVGPAIIVGDSLGLGICIGGVQQLCNHLPVCNGAGSSAGPDGAPALTGPNSNSVGSSVSAAVAGSGDDRGGSVASDNVSYASPPPAGNMTNPDATYIRVQSFENAMRRNFFSKLGETPAHVRRKAYVDFITARGSVNWDQALGSVEPYNRAYDVFAVTDDDGALREQASYHQGITYRANLGFLGAVPNLVDRLNYVESRFWTEEEKLEYLDGLDPETELRKTMSPLLFDALKKVAIQDWRLLAQVAPDEPALPFRTYDGFRLGSAPIVTVAQDCRDEASVSVVVSIEDSEEANNDGTTYPAIVDWGDGQVTRHTLDAAQSTNALTHDYSKPGTYLAYVTVANSTGLRGVAGLVVESTGDGEGSVSTAMATIALNDVVVYSPSVTIAGQFTLEMEARRENGPSEPIGWADLTNLNHLAPNHVGDIVGHNESLVPFETLVWRPFHSGAALNGGFLNSVYFKSDSLTLGFPDQRVGAITEHTIALTQDNVRIYYQGATEPVPAEQIERDLNGDILLPVKRENPNLAADFCGAEPCEVVDRIEVDITPQMLDLRPEHSPISGKLAPGDTARWIEDVPNQFMSAPEGNTEVVGSCTSEVNARLVTAGVAMDSLVTDLRIEPTGPVVSGGAPTQLSAQATLQDGTTVDVTKQVTWKVSDPAVVTVSNGSDKGQLSSAIVAGTATVTAALGGKTTTANATNDVPVAGFQSYRIHFDAVHGPAGRAGITSVELIVEDRVLENSMTSPSEGSIGLFPATVESSDGGDPTNVFDASNGSGWFSVDEAFSRTAPYAVNAAPVYVQVNFATQVPVEGLRILRTAGINPVSFRPHFPQQIRVQGSNDGTTFTDVPGAAVTLIDWIGEPATMRW